MTVHEIEEEVILQADMDINDLDDLLPSLRGYINDGYDRLVYAYAGRHTETGDETYPPLSLETDEPNLPGWIHRAISDYATYMVYRNGNALKQNRGMAYLQNFEDVRRRLSSEGRATQFINIP